MLRCESPQSQGNVLPPIPLANPPVRDQVSSPPKSKIKKSALQHRTLTFQKTVILVAVANKA